MFYIYLLKVKSDKNKFYIGFTGNLKQRLREHLSENVKTTKRLKNPKLIYFEAYQDRDSAREREMQLKRFGSAYYGLLKRINAM